MKNLLKVICLSSILIQTNFAMAESCKEVAKAVYDTEIWIDKAAIATDKADKRLAVNEDTLFASLAYEGTKYVLKGTSYVGKAPAAAFAMAKDCVFNSVNNSNREKKDLPLPSAIEDSTDVQAKVTSK